MDFNFIKYRKIYYIFTGILVAVSAVSLFLFGLKPGIDFTGGSILEVDYNDQRPQNQEISQKISSLDLGEVSIQPTGEKGVILRMKNIDENIHQEVIRKLGDVAEKRFESIGPSIGMELKSKTTTVIVLSLLAMVLYIIFAFRKMSFPVRSWQYGIATLFILFHDILIPVGVFSVLGKLYGVQITIPVIVALLAVLGYAINNVVVVFDRIRENLLRSASVSFEDVVNNAIKQTLTRQFNTSLTTLFPLVFIYLLGGQTLKYFALALILGIIAGFYSSIFLAGPILVSWLGRHKD
ncbi:MAG: protein translocase subunit SecF [Patescibacteria group bacterium]